MVLSLPQKNKIVQYAYAFFEETSWGQFIPCYCNTATNQKPPCKGVNLAEKQYHWDELTNFPTIECVGLFLGDRWVSFDCDGTAALKKLAELSKELGSLPETLHVSSKPEEREALIFEIPFEYRRRMIEREKRIRFENGEKLEFFSGNGYQIIVGKHPTNGEYQHLTDVVKPALLPDSWCNWLTVLEEKAPPVKDTPKTTLAIYDYQKSTEQLIAEAKQMLEILIALEYSWVDLNERNTRFRIGAIFHSIDSGEASKEACFEIWQMHETFNLEKSEKLWGEYKEKSNGATFGSLKWHYDHFMGVAQKSNDSEKITKIKQFGNIPKPTYSLDDEAGFISAIAEQVLGHDELTLECQKFCKAIHGRVDRVYVSDLVRKAESYTAEYPELKIRTDKCEFPIWERIENFYSEDTGIHKEVKKYSDTFGMNWRVFFVSWLIAQSALLPKRLTVEFGGSTLSPNLMFLIVGKPTSGKSRYTKPLVKWFIEKCNENLNLESDEEPYYKKAKQAVEKSLDKIVDQAKENNIPVKEALLTHYAMLTGGNEFSVKNQTLIESWQQSDLSDFAIYKKIVDKLCPQTQYHKYGVAQATEEAIRQVCSECLTKGILICPDEIMSQVQYTRKLSGGDNSKMHQTLLNFLEATSTMSLLKSERTKADFYQGAILSTIHPQILRDNFDIEKDANGFISRCLFFNKTDIEDAPSTAKNMDAETEFYAALANFYTVLDMGLGSERINHAVPFSDEAREVWKEFVEKHINSENTKALDFSSPTLFQFYRRAHEKVCKFALILECSRSLTLPESISAEAVLIAIDIVLWFSESIKEILKTPTELEQANIDPGKLAAFDIIVKHLRKQSDQTLVWKRDNNFTKAKYPELFEPWGFETYRLSKAAFITVSEELHKHKLAKFNREKMSITLVKQNT